MFPFFKKKKKSGGDTAVSAREIVEEAGDVSDTEDVYTELSLHPSWNVPAEEQYVLRFLNNELLPLKPNQISLSGISLSKEIDGVVVSAFVRHSLPKPIQIGRVPLLLLREDGSVLARKEFDLRELGELPPKTSRPWRFIFGHDTLRTDDIPSEGWKLAFELKPKHRLELDKSWEEALPETEKEALRRLVDELGPPKAGEVNFFGLQAVVADGELRVTVLIRNGSDKTIYLEQLPLQVEDAAGEVVAKGGFKLDRLEVKANTTKPWTFIFPQSLIQKEEPDFSRWKLSVIRS
ncbi:accessory Sec system S-layer assembly protein [Geobacillus thermodenitrificans]|uniref:accessory Sec system S-layer assembly protein n=1 Tax=Geobacillus thermodenitrificans TaxID=33940 RepID=UPI002E1C6BDE|nr:accessory Sec system S-layer assembly protein [Geobacillus thermodenitrificans]MED3906333.1 accessory Sec system S-layer assembly protein [Geobacillus thermodenitrificans]